MDVHGELIAAAVETAAQSIQALTTVWNHTTSTQSVDSLVEGMALMDFR